MKPDTEASRLSRRHFLKQSTVASLSLAGLLVGPGHVSAAHPSASHPIKIANVSANFERETLVRPFGFKGA